MGGLVLAVAGAGFWLGRDDDDPPSRAQPDLDVEALPPAARELVELASRGGPERYHAVYEASDGASLEIWVDGDDAREESRLEDGRRQVVVRDGTESTSCVEVDGAWDCAAPTEDPAGLASTVEQLVVDLAGSSLAVADDTILDRAVRCFTVTSGEGDVEACIEAGGVIARLAAGDLTLTLTALDDEVPEDGFDPPS